jgi:hypothetical protein
VVAACLAVTVERVIWAKEENWPSRYLWADHVIHFSFLAEDADILPVFPENLGRRGFTEGVSVSDVPIRPLDEFKTNLLNIFAITSV